MKTNKSQGYTSTGSINPTAKQLAPGKKMKGADGNLIVNYHSMFFKMTHLGRYIPWSQTVHHGKLMPSQEWSRLKEILGTVETLSEFQNKRAAKIAMELKNDPLYTLTSEQRNEVMINKENYANAKNEGVSVEEYLRRQDIRNTRAANKIEKSISAKITKITPIPIKKENGRTNFLFGYVPGFKELRKKFATM